MIAKLKTLLAITSCAAVLLGFSSLAGSNVVERSPTGGAYDLVVHVKNVPTYGYNPEVSDDRAKMAVRLARRYCKGAHVVGQRTINTEIFGITSEKPDYVVFIRCARQ
jgi:hypothetical protein